MSKLGSKNISSITKQSLLLNKPKPINYDSSLNQIKEYLPLIESFSQKDFLNYENLIRRFSSGQGTIENMIRSMDKIGLVDGPCRQLAEIRSKDRYNHQKIIQQLRYRWYDYEHLYRNKIKDNPDLFWDSMATKLLRTPKERSHIHLSEKWQGNEGKTELKKFLINLYEKQEGKCAITGIPLLLEVGVKRPLPNKCSLDRINSKNGYTRQNVWFVTWWVNQMKMDLPLETFKERIKILSESFESKLDNNLK